MTASALHIAFAPHLPAHVLAALAIAAALATLFAARANAGGALLRALFFALLFLALLNPSVIAEKREALHDIALLAIDDSASMKIGDRTAQATTAEDALTKKLAAMPDLDVETIHVKGSEETDLFRAIDDRLSALPKSRMAGIIAVTDGEIHDAPASSLPAPFHVLIAGHHDEADRRIEIRAAPAYGIVGHGVTVTLRVTDDGKGGSGEAPVTYMSGDGKEGTIEAPTGKDIPFDVPVTHAGPNLFVFSTPPLPRELTALNNTTSVTVNGVRDRLRVLLVSGQPHIGGRVWRNFLKSDPAVDLIHFTILRSPASEGNVPESELALIAFPVHELFEAKLRSFDLVIFDCFKNQMLIPDIYLTNIAKYVEGGGALLLSNSTEAGIPSLARSPLAGILPAEPTGELLTGAFVPALTEAGKRHPVTDTLESLMSRGSWGPWFRQIGSRVTVGDVLMTGLGGQPLLVLAHEGDGRVAEFMSDQFWLWSRGAYDTGPEAELLRRTVHWLMGEPELDETALRAHAESDGAAWKIIVTRQSLHDDSASVTVTGPDSNSAALTLTRGATAGVLAGTFTAPAPGLYHIKDKDQETLVMAGPGNAPEFGRMVATEDVVAPIVKSTGGGISWLEDHAEGPELRRTGASSAQQGWGWIGLRQNGQYRVTGSKAYPLLPPPLAIILLLAAAMLAWRCEGRD